MAMYTFHNSTPELGDPSIIGRWFAVPQRVTAYVGLYGLSSVKRYWLASADICSYGNNTRCRMGDEGMAAFLALLEGIVERAGIISLTDDTFPPPSSTIDFSSLSRTVTNNAFFLLDDATLFHADRTPTYTGRARCDFAGELERGRERQIWESLVRAAFNLVFGTSTASHYVQVSAGSEYYNDNLVIYPFCASDFDIGSIGIAESQDIVFERIYGMSDCTWENGRGAHQERGTAFIGPNVYWPDRPMLFYSLLDSMLRIVGSSSHTIENFYLAGGYDFHYLIADSDLGRRITDVWDNDTTHNWWDRPTTTTTVQSLSDGPVGITKRRPQLAYAIIQQMVATLIYSAAKFPVHARVKHVEETRTMEWVVSWNSSSGSLDISGPTTTDESNTTYIDGVTITRNRGLASLTTTIDGVVEVSTTPSGSGFENYWLKSSSQIQALDPNFNHTGAMYTDLLSPYEDDGMKFSIDFPGGSMSIKQVLSRMNPDFGDVDGFAQEVWPWTGGSKEYVESQKLTVAEKFEDLLPLANLYGTPTRQTDGERFRIKTWSHSSGTGSWSGNVRDMAESWRYAMPFSVPVSMPAAATLNNANVQNMAAQSMRWFAARMATAHATYRFRQCFIMIGGMEWYVPWSLWWDDGVSAYFDETPDNGVFRCVVHGVPFGSGTGSEDIWGGAVGIEESYRIRHSFGVGGVRWNFKASPSQYWREPKASPSQYWREPVE